MLKGWVCADGGGAFVAGAWDRASPVARSGVENTTRRAKRFQVMQRASAISKDESVQRSRGGDDGRGFPRDGANILSVTRSQ